MRNENELMGREDGAGVSARVTYLVLGGLVGAAVALLFAPKSGHELRGDIADATRKGIDRTRETASQVGARAGEYYEATRDRASQLYSSASDKAGEVAGVARDAASRSGGQLSAAIEAGKQAYREEKRRTENFGMSPAGANYPAESEG